MTQQSDENYLTTAEVARRLNVKPETIYAYVSRGQLTSVRARGRRGSLFLASDVERLASRSVEHPGVVERIETELSLLQDDELYYRGLSVRELVKTDGRVGRTPPLDRTGAGGPAGRRLGLAGGGLLRRVSWFGWLGAGWGWRRGGLG